MYINISYDSSVTSGSFTNYKADGFASGADEEAAFKKAVTAACNELESLFTNPVTLNITFAWGGVSPGDAASNNSPDTFQNFDYGTLRTALSNTKPKLSVSR